MRSSSSPSLSSRSSCFITKNSGTSSGMACIQTSSPNPIFTSCGYRTFLFRRSTSRAVGWAEDTPETESSTTTTFRSGIPQLGNGLSFAVPIGGMQTRTSTAFPSNVPRGKQPTSCPLHRRSWLGPTRVGLRPRTQFGSLFILHPPIRRKSNKLSLPRCLSIPQNLPFNFGFPLSLRQQIAIAQRGRLQFTPEIVGRLGSFGRSLTCRVSRQFCANLCYHLRYLGYLGHCRISNLRVFNDRLSRALN